MSDFNEPTKDKKLRKKVLGSSLNAAVLANHGKLPPQAKDLEEAVLGALMLEKDALTAVIDILSPHCFYVEAHQRVYNAIMQLFQQSEPVDILTVVNQLRKNGELEITGGAFFVTQLTNRVASAANVEYHSRIVLQKHIQRELIRISSEVIKDAFEDTTDVFDLLDKAEKNLFDLAEGNIRKNYSTMSDLLIEAKKQIEIAANQKSGVTGVPSGFTELDKVTSGWQKADLLIIAARPGMGKTAFVLSLSRNAAIRFHKPVAIFSLEMSSIQLVNRLIASETELSAEKLKKGQLNEHEWKQLSDKISDLTDAPIYIDDTPALSIFELRAKCRRLKAQHNIELIVIDYLQLMSGGTDGKSGNREQEISNISRSLKSIAKELSVPIIALSQLSRAVETRGGDKRPILSDLRESGAIEQDADMVMFIYRPEYYDIDEDEQGNSNAGMAEIIIAKHRNGSLKNVPLRFVGHLAKFTDLESSDFIEMSYLQSKDYNTGSIIRSSRMNDMPEDSPF